MRIGIDIDNTLCKTFYITEKIYNKYHTLDFKSLGMYEQYEFSADYEKDIFDNCPLQEGADKIINKLALNNEIYFITARCNRRINDIENRTRTYLKKHGIKYNDIFFGYDHKLDKYRELNLDIMIDDDLMVYESIINNNGKCILFDSYINRSFKGDKAYNWDDVYNMLKKEV